MQDQHQNGCSELAQTNPEYEELLESGYVAVAQSMLMRGSHEYEDYLLKELGNNPKDIIETPQELTCDITEAMKTGIYVSGTSGVGKSDLAMYISDLMMCEGILVLVVDTSQDWIFRSNIPNVVKVEGMTSDYSLDRSTIFDTSQLTVIAQKEFIERLCAMIWRHQTTVSYRKPIFVWFEEGHIGFPLGAFRSKRYSEAVRVATVGRNIETRIGIITPFASMVSKDVMKYMKQRYFGFSAEPNDVDYIAGFIGRDKAEELRNLKNGCFLYSYNGLNKMIRIEEHTQKTKPRRLLMPKPSIPQPTPKQQHSDPKAISSILLLLLWLAILYVALR